MNTADRDEITQLRAQLAAADARVESLRGALEDLEDLWSANQAHWAPGFDRGVAALVKARAALAGTK